MSKESDEFAAHLAESIKRRFSWPPGYCGINPGDSEAHFRVMQEAWAAYDAKQALNV